jgi:hypothetical protein
MSRAHAAAAIANTNRNEPKPADTPFSVEVERLLLHNEMSTVNRRREPGVIA